MRSERCQETPTKKNNAMEKKEKSGRGIYWAAMLWLLAVSMSPVANPTTLPTQVYTEVFAPALFGVPIVDLAVNLAALLFLIVVGLALLALVFGSILLVMKIKYVLAEDRAEQLRMKEHYDRVIQRREREARNDRPEAQNEECKAKEPRGM